VEPGHLAEVSHSEEASPFDNYCPDLGMETAVILGDAFSSLFDGDARKLEVRVITR